MNFLMLDIEGVLQTGRWDKIRDSKQGPNKTHFDPSCVELLNICLKETGAKIVATTNWRLSYNLDRFNDLLWSEGVRGECVGFTPDLIYFPAKPVHEASRGLEIITWVVDHLRCGDSWFAVDDQPDNRMKPFTVQTTWETGMTVAHTHLLVDALSTGRVTKEMVIRPA